MACFGTNTQSKWFFRKDFHPEAERANDVLRDIFRHGYEPRESMKLFEVLQMGYWMGIVRTADWNAIKDTL
jgi:hypothetical protein